MVDVPANTSTTSTISVGGTVNGFLDTPGDHDWYAITLTAGQSITITLNGSGAQPVPDTYLNLRDAAGNIVAWNDDTGGGYDSKIVFTPSVSGTYYIDAGAWDSQSQPQPGPDQYTGNYTLSVQLYTPPPVWTDDQIANQLVNGFWNVQGGQTAHHFAVTQGGTITVNLTGLTVTGNPTLTSQIQNLARTALAEWSDIIGVTFREVTTGGQIVFHNGEDPSSPGPRADTEAHFSNGIISSADVNISTSWVTRYGTGLNTYSFQTFIHEIGHALGLGHAGNYNGTADYAADALYANDAWSTTVMSYFDQQDNAYFTNLGFTKDLALTPMVADILAMQSLYGLSTTTRAGDTTYGFNSNAGRDVYNASIMQNVAYTIFDSGGNDTLDYSGTAATQTINLNPETFSNVLGQIGNVSIARGTVIENAIGGSGNDTIYGNDAANWLIGNAGNDTLFGGAGDDFLDGGPGVDQMTGGPGADTFNGTKASLSGDSIMDFGVGDKIVITDATLLGFTFNLSGNTLAYTGGSLAIAMSSPGAIVASAAAGGGVQLAMKHHPTNDFNGDGRSDILLRNADGTVTDWKGTASGGFSSNSGNFNIHADSSWQIAGVGDFNGDGRDDLIWRNSDGTVTSWLGQANGDFAGNANFYTHADSSWQIAGVGDFNGDGRDDILWRNSDGTITDWLGQTNGGFAGNGGNFNIRADSSWQIAGIGDFNGDGRDDLIWRNSDGTITSWLGQANGGFAGNANFYTHADSSWQIAGMGDFNGDGRDDILWRGSDGTIIDWLGQANGGFAGNANFYTHADSSWQIAGVGDFNGDGRDDILWRNSDGTITSWLGTSAGGFQPGQASYAMSPTWHVEDHLSF